MAIGSGYKCVRRERLKPPPTRTSVLGFALPPAYKVPARSLPAQPLLLRVPL